MSQIEEASLGRQSGLKILLVSTAPGFTCALPLGLYVAFGPADGNPIRPGLLAVVALPVTGIGAAVGLITMVVQHFMRRGR